MEAKFIVAELAVTFANLRGYIFYQLVNDTRIKTRLELQPMIIVS